MEELQLKRGQPDFLIIIVTFMLLGIGLVMVYSASQIFAYMNFNGDSAYFLKRQSLWAVTGIIMMLLFMNVPYTVYKRLVPVILVVLLAMMCMVLTDLGEARKGAQRWLNLGFITIQPSEFVKLGVIIYLASIYSKKQEYINNFFRGVFPPLVIVGIFFGLILLQKDLGTGMALILYTMVMIFCSGAQFRHMFGLGLVSTVIFFVFAYTQEYRWARIISFRDPWTYAETTGFQLIQSLYAIGHGGIAGTGFGNSIQKYLYLPDAHTDFIFAIIAEELGFIGVVLILLLYVLLVIRGIQIANRIHDTFAALLAIGIVAMIGIQTFINIGVVSGLLPTTGIALPFLSYGGSSLLLTMISIGILLNISRYAKNA